MLSNLEAYNKIVKNEFLAVIIDVLHQQQLEEMSDFTPTKFLSQMNLAENAFSSREELPDWAGRL